MSFLNVPTYWHMLAISVLLSIAGFLAFPYTLHQKPLPKEKPQNDYSNWLYRIWRTILNTVSFIIADRALIKFALICFATMACENLMYDWSGIYVREAVHASEKVVTTGLLVFMVSVASGRFVGDRVRGRWGIKRLLINSSF